MDPTLVSIDENIDEFLSRERKKTLQQKFGINKEYIEKSDLEKLIQRMHLKIDTNDLNKIFNQLDVDGSGKVSVSTLVEHVLKKENEGRGLQDIFKKINDQLTTKSERIILKLKKLKEKAAFKNDAESLDDLDWIISSFSEDMFEPEVNKVIDQGKQLKMDSAIDWLAQASKVQQDKFREDDILKATSCNSFKKLKTVSILKKNSHIISASSFNSIDEMLKDLSFQIENRKSSNLSELPSDLLESVKNSLDKINTFEFDIFCLDSLVETKTLHFMAYEIFNRYNYFEELIDENKYKNFIREIINGYNRKVVYHNDLHAGDVLQTVYVMIEHGDLINKLNLNDIDVISSFLASICHDFKHNGFNNMYHINDKSPIAITYNDSSVLENYHVSETFKIIIKEENNLLCKLEKEEWRLVRRRMIDCIIATDMANHAKHLNTLKAKLETFDIRNGKNVERMIFPDNVAKTYENQQMVLNMCIHSADVSNPAKPAHLNKIWVEKVFIEFFNQGDLEKEKNLPVSLLCDRETTNIIKSQIGFINFVVVPTFETLMNIIPHINPYMDIIKANMKRYENLLQDEECKINIKNNLKKP